MTSTFLQMITLVLASTCEISLNSVQHYEDEILASIEHQEYTKVEENFECLMANYERLNGVPSILASRFIDGLLGRKRPQNVNPDKRTLKLQSWLREQLLKSNQRVMHSFLVQRAHSKNNEIKPFCRGGNHESCQVFLPTDKMIKKNSAILASMQILQLAEAREFFPAPIAQKIKKRLHSLQKDKTLDALVQKTLNEVLKGLSSPPTTSIS